VRAGRIFPAPDPKKATRRPGMSATQSFVPMSAEEKAAFMEMATPKAEEAPAVTPAPVVEPVVAPAATPPAPVVVTPAPETVALQENVQSLAEMQAETQAQLAALTATLLAERGEDPNKQPTLEESMADESEAVRALAAKFAATEKLLGDVSAKLQVREAAELQTQQEAALLSEGQALFTQFPGLTAEDFKKVYEKIGQSEDVASRLSVEQVAVEVLGVAYLADRRKAAAPAPRTPAVPGNEPPPATLVDTSGPGGAAGGDGAPATGTIRDACQAALLTDRHKFGKFS
jgi:hypothetical protein